MKKFRSIPNALKLASSFNLIKYAFIISLLLLCVGAGKFSAAPGDLDTTFNPNSALSNGTIIQKMAVQTDGKVLVSRFFNGQVSLLRLNQDGSLDNSFNAVGVIPNPGLLDAIALQADGKILVSTNTFGGPIDPKLKRLNADGSVDNSFSISGANDNILVIAPQADGKILVSGNFTSYQGDFGHVRIARLNSDGSVDNTFNAGAIPFNGTFGVNRVAVQVDDKILISGDFTSIGDTGRNRIARLNANGSVDTSFNPGFGIEGGTNKIVQSIKFQSDGKIIIGGDFTSYNGTLRRGIARINTDGSLDASFNAGFSASAFQISSLAIQSNGKIVAGSDNAFIVRLNSNGTNDSSFVATVNAPVTGVALQANGRIFVSGSFSTVNGIARNGVARLLGDPHSAPFDFDGDGKADFGVFRPSTSIWYLLNSQTGFSATQFGLSTDRAVPADYDGDGKTDIAVYRDGQWWIAKSSGGLIVLNFGLASDIPAPADFDGDSRAEIAVYRPSTGVWYILNLATNQVTITQFGISEDKPVQADYDGDGKADIAVFRPSTGVWYTLRSTQGLAAQQFGVSTDKPVTADYDGDGKADLAVFRPSNGTWWIQASSTAAVSVTAFGLSADKPVAGDYDGDGKADIALWRSSDGIFYVLRSGSGFLAAQFGLSGDMPLANSYIP
jgi:uncharacterized delta-60 repeat protein